MKKEYSEELILLYKSLDKIKNLGNYLQMKVNRELAIQLKVETDFLKYDAQNSERLWYVQFQTDETPLCQHEKCNNIVKWNPSKNCYRDFCSNKCMASANTTKEKRKQTNLKKYGSEFAQSTEIVKQKQKETNLKKYGFVSSAQNEKVKEKQKATNIKRYGCENAFSSDIIKEKIKQTNLEKYGVENPQQNENIRKKTCQTNLERYGSSMPLTLDTFKEKSKQTNLEKYGAENPQQNKEIREKTKKTNIERYGGISPAHNCEILEKMKQTNLEKYGVENINQRHIPKNVLDLLNSRRFLEEEYILKKRTTVDISDEFNITDGCIGRRLRNFNIEIQQYNDSLPQRQLTSFMTQYTNTISNVKDIINPQELDIYLPEHNIAIEYNGLYWHSEIYKDNNYHLNKTLMCQENGIRLIHVFEDEWIENQEIVKEKLLNIIGKSEKPRIYARKCKLVNATKQLKKEFLNDNHIQSNCKSSIDIGLTYDNKLVAIMCFFKRKDDIYELNRFATSYNVIGGFSKLLKHFQRNYEWQEIVSFADRRWSVGGVYEKNNFELVQINKPDYMYVIKNKRKHKFGFRHKHLKTKLKNYDPKLSEHENCLNNNIYRIYNCGLLKYVLKNEE